LGTILQYKKSALNLHRES